MNEEIKKLLSGEGLERFVDDEFETFFEKSPFRDAPEDSDLKVAMQGSYVGGFTEALKKTIELLNKLN